MPLCVTDPASQLFEIGRRLCAAVGIDQGQAARLTDAERLAVAREIARLADIGARQVSAGRAGAFKAHGTPLERKRRVKEMQRHADRLAAMNPSLSWREISRRVGLAFNLSGCTVRRHCDNPLRKPGAKGLSAPPVE